VVEEDHVAALADHAHAHAVFLQFFPELGSKAKIELEFGVPL
jgi:hypothetical protein